jgi:ribonucleoside-diphosphate reductase alpha chain
MGKAKRPKILSEKTVKMLTGCGNMYVTVTDHETKPFEVFSFLGKAGGCPRCYGEAVSRCISIGLRYGIPISEFIEHLEGLACPSPALEEGNKIASCPDAIAQAMKVSIEANEALELKI